MLKNYLLQAKKSLKKKNKAEIVGLIDPISDAAEEQNQKEMELRKLADEISSYTHKDSDVSIAKDFLETSNKASQSRLEVIQRMIDYIDGKINDDTLLGNVETALNRISEVKETERALINNTYISIPHFFAIYSQDEIDLPKGKKRNITFEISNLSSSPISDIDLETVSTIESEIDPNVINRMGSGEKVTVNMKCRSAERGYKQLEIEGSTEKINKSYPIEIRTLNKEDYLNRNIRQIQLLKEEVGRIQIPEDGKNRQGNQASKKGRLKREENAKSKSTPSEKWQAKDNAFNRGTSNRNNQGKKLGKIPDTVAGLTEKLEEAERRISEIKAILDSTSEGTINNRIASVINLIEAVINQSEGLEVMQIYTSNARLIQLNSETVISTLSEAQDAAV